MADCRDQGTRMGLEGMEVEVFAQRCGCFASGLGV